MKNAVTSFAVLAFVALVSTSMLAVFQGATYNPYVGESPHLQPYLMIN